MPGRNGGTLLVGPTNKGGPGRPPDAFKRFMADIADRAAQALAVSAIVEDPEHPFFLAAAKWAADRGYGRAEEKATVNQETVIRVVMVDETDGRVAE